MANVRRAVEMLILGLLAERPAHAYQLRRTIEGGIGHLQRVSDGMLYPLLKDLSERGLVLGRLEAGENAPDKRVYELRQGGEDRLRELLIGPLDCQGFDDKIDFYARFALFDRVPPSDRQRILRERAEACYGALDKLATLAATTDDQYRLELIGRVVSEIDDECRWLLKKLETAI